MSSAYIDLKSIFKGVLLVVLCLKPGLIAGIPSPLSESYNHSADNYTQAKSAPTKILGDYFVSKGFITGKIKIPELAVEVLLEENQFYKKEKNVVDVYERINEIRKQFGLPVPYSDYSRGYGWCGVLNAECIGEKAFGYIVLVKENLNAASNIYTNAHENGHFLWYIGKQELIYKKFRKPDLVRSHIHTNGDFAVLCGWVAMKMAAYHLEDCFIINSENPELEKKIERIKNLARNYLLDKNP